MGLFGKKRDETGRVPTKPGPGNPLAPPVDLSIPVTNPELLEALQAAQPDDASMSRLIDAVLNATFLLAIQHSHPDGAPALQDGVLRQGSLLTLYSVVDEADNRTLALFTDWDALHASAGSDGWHGQVVPARDALQLAAAQFGGHAVVNPHGPVATLGLTPEQTHHLLETVQSR